MTTVSRERRVDFSFTRKKWSVFSSRVLSLFVVDPIFLWWSVAILTEIIQPQVVSSLVFDPIFLWSVVPWYIL